jgi:hypothetical protein
VNTEPESTNKYDRTALKQQWYTGCLVVLLLTTAFVIGGLLGGMAGGGLVLWATDTEFSLLGMPLTPTVTPIPSATPTLTSYSVSHRYAFHRRHDQPGGTSRGDRREPAG